MKNKNYNELAKKNLSIQKWDNKCLTAIIILFGVSALIAAWIRIDIGIKLLISGIAIVGIGALFVPSLFPYTDQKKIELYAEYLEKIDNLEAERKTAIQENRDYICN